MSVAGNIFYSGLAAMGAGGIGMSFYACAKTREIKSSAIRLAFIGAVLFEQGGEAVSGLNIPGPHDVGTAIAKFIKDHPAPPLPEKN